MLTTLIYLPTILTWFETNKKQSDKTWSSFCFANTSQSEFSRSGHGFWSWESILLSCLRRVSSVVFFKCDCFSLSGCIPIPELRSPYISRSYLDEPMTTEDEESTFSNFFDCWTAECWNTWYDYVRWSRSGNVKLQLAPQSRDDENEFDPLGFESIVF